jgi:protein required for attachment to host cells
MKPIRTYILIADGARARILLSEGPGKPLAEVQGSEQSQEIRPEHEMGADRPGRVHESASVVRHAIERADLHRREKDRFALSLAASLETRLAAGEYDRLVIAAAPETLGIIRASLSEKVRAVVRAEVPKDLTKLPNTQVRDHLGAGLMV